MKTQELTVQTEQPPLVSEVVTEQSEDKMLQAMDTADTIVRMTHLAKLDQMQIIPLSESEKRIAPESKVRLLHITCLTYDAQEDILEKLSGVFGAVANYDASAVFILRHDGSRIHLYMGTACEDPQILSLVFGTFERALKGNFPGCTSEILSNSASRDLLADVFDYDEQDDVAIASVSSIASRRGDQAATYLQGMEKLTDAMKGIPFALVVLASALSHDTIAMMRQGYETLYTELSPFYKQNAALSESDTSGFSKTVGESIAKSISMTTGTNTSTSKTTGTSGSKSVSKEHATKQEKRIVGLGAALSVAAASFNPSFAFLGSSVMQSFQTITGTKPSTQSETTTEHTDRATSEGTNKTKGVSDTNTTTDSTTDSTSTTQGKSMTYTIENRSIGTILEAIDGHIKRLNACEGNGAYRCAAYLIAADQATAQMGASLYRSLLSGDAPESNVSYVNAWQNPADTAMLCEYMKHMKHPQFAADSMDFALTELSAAVPTTAAELPVHCAWPRKPLPGLTVTTHAEFARDIISSSADEPGVTVGQIYHMGNTEPCAVQIAPSELRKHMFVCGAPGSGKSNFCYVLLNHLAEIGVNFMVIEPAKGEYASVFGGRNDVSVFGTNSLLTPQLSINPFEFPEGVHLLEHLDRMIEVFNASWPMYAAMPALLKEALEKAYEVCGWDLESGLCAESPAKFPTFSTLLDILPKILKQTEYSQEVQGNYIGSLVTRVKSMTNGICGKIFCSDPIPDETLFDGNTIIDISRLGSAETKALIMGIMVIRLQEYRSCHRHGINETLRHVTLLEEAHHLLRQASTTQSMESANLRGMSVEILTNAIAEMRTYGEGFIIADQTPSVMAEAVIGNTSTKVIFKLPNIKDRIPVGNAVALNEAQTNEIAKLETGVAVMHQSHWINPVLCKIDYYPEDQFAPLQYTPQTATPQACLQTRSAAIRCLLTARAEQKAPAKSDCEAILQTLGLSVDAADKRLLRFLNDLLKKQDASLLTVGALGELLCDVFGKNVLPAFSKNDLLEWYLTVKSRIEARAPLSQEALQTVISILIVQKKDSDPDARDFYFSWKAFLGKLKREAKNSQN